MELAEGVSISVSCPNTIAPAVAVLLAMLGSKVEELATAVWVKEPAAMVTMVTVSATVDPDGKVPMVAVTTLP